MTTHAHAGAGGTHESFDDHVFVQATAPTAPDNLEIGDIWSDTNASLVKRCTSTAPVTFVSIEGGGSGSMTTVKESGVQLGGADIVVLDFGSGFDLTEDPDTEINISLDLSETTAVLAASAIGDNLLVRGDGGAQGVQDSGITVNNSDQMRGATLDHFTNTIHADAEHIEVRNESGGTLTKGTPVYISGYSVGQDLALVAAADSDGSGTMPAIGLLDADIENNATGECLAEGRLSGLDTDSFSVGDILYISTTPGVLTATKPTGDSDLIQSIGEVLRSHATLGIIEILGAGRTNDIPNSAIPTGAWDYGGATSVEVPNGAGGTTLDAAGEVAIDTTSRTLNLHDGTAEVVLNPVVKIGSITIEDPVAADDIQITRIIAAMTVTRMEITTRGSSTPSVTVDVRHHTDRSDAGNALITSPTASTEAANNAESTGHTITSFDDATIPANSAIWVEFDAQSGTVDEVNIVLYGRQDP